MYRGNALLTPRKPLCSLSEEEHYLHRSKAMDNQTYHLTIDYTLSLAQMIEAGRYTSVHQGFTAEHFLLVGIGQVEVEAQLVHPNKKASTEEVLQHLDSLGLRPAILPELLAFGAQYPDVWKPRGGAVALGTTWVNPDGEREVPGLYEDDIGEDTIQSILLFLLFLAVPK
jgi:hypothetical protein